MASHQKQAEELLNAMKPLIDDVPEYKSAVALLAVHSAIAFNDAVLRGLRALFLDGAEVQSILTEAGKQEKNVDGKKLMQEV